MITMVNRQIALLLNFLFFSLSLVLVVLLGFLFLLGINEGSLNPVKSIIAMLILLIVSFSILVIPIKKTFEYYHKGEFGKSILWSFLCPILLIVSTIIFTLVSSLITNFFSWLTIIKKTPRPGFEPRSPYGHTLSRRAQ